MGRDGQPWSVCSAAQATTLIQPVLRDWSDNMACVIPHIVHF